MNEAQQMTAMIGLEVADQAGDYLGRCEGLKLYEADGCESVLAMMVRHNRGDGKVQGYELSEVAGEYVAQGTAR